MPFENSREVHRSQMSAGEWEISRIGSEACDWRRLAEQVLDGYALRRDEALAILASSDDELLDLVAAAYRIRRHYFGKTVQLYFLMNAKSGLCPEDCHYCSQSKISTADIPRYNILSREKLLDGAREARQRNARTYCIVISGREPHERELRAIEEVVPEIKARYGLHICACLGLLTTEQARRLKACGVDRVNHNLNTGPDYYGKICTTHTYQDRLATLRAVRQAGLELCCGGIAGMGERPDDLVAMAMELRELRVESIPVNFLIAIDGTPLAGTSLLAPADCLRVLAMFRFTNPASELRIAGGREVHLRTLQPLGLYIANSVFVGDYLTTKGQPPEADYAMIRDMGFEITRQGAPEPLLEEGAGRDGCDHSCV
ncbi:MAG: biotin synthase [Pirellulaceae bacterium]|nr:MAG: biotin synthase [Pirellulaceae bacterium]